MDPISQPSNNTLIFNFKRASQVFEDEIVTGGSQPYMITPSDQSKVSSREVEITLAVSKPMGGRKIFTGPNEFLVTNKNMARLKQKLASKRQGRSHDFFTNI